MKTWKCRNSEKFLRQKLKGGLSLCIKSFFSKHKITLNEQLIDVAVSGR